MVVPEAGSSRASSTRCPARAIGALRRTARARTRPSGPSAIGPRRVEYRDLGCEVVDVGTHANRGLQLAVAKQISERSAQTRAHETAKCVASAGTDERLRKRFQPQAIVVRRAV
jgi:hypothetical protein